MRNSVSPNRRIAISVDPRVELIGIVFRLAGNVEYKQCRIESHATDIDKYFGDFNGHPVVELARKLRETRRMSCDGPMSLAIYIDRDFRPLKSFDQWPWGLDGRWRKAETIEFLDRLKQFAAETRFDEFFKAHEPLYEKGLGSCRAIVAQHDLAGWFDEFFGIKKSDDLRMALSLVNGCSNYGLRVTTETGMRKYAIVGMEFCDSHGDPVFDPRLLVLAAHEFCHSFTNPIVNKYMDQLQPAAEKFYAAHASTMSSVGYKSWQTMMRESAVRACVASFVRDSLEPGCPGLYRLYIEREARFGFVWIEQMDNLLKTYEADRRKYPTFESFFPEFVTFFNKYSEESGN
ncbi:MAG: DUF4932 domain-containing protein [Sedimentisphaerales bacterium]